MKRIYWRPKKISRTVLLVLAILSLAGLATVELVKTTTRQPRYRAKMRAAKTAQVAFAALKAERISRGHVLDASIDPAQSGLIGLAMSEVTSNSGHLGAKRTSANPNFAAVVVHLLDRAGVEEGDYVAVGLSGSFPALNICVLAALEAMKVHPVVISSASASQWGANIPDLIWLDMEQILEEKRILSTRSVAASIGGVEDRGVGMPKEGKELLIKAIDERHRIPRIQARNYDDSLEQRMAIFDEWVGNEQYAAYINVGGGATSVGTKVGKKLFTPGLNRNPPKGGPSVDSVMMRFADRGIPVLHFVQIVDLAKRYGMPEEPDEVPAAGESNVFVKEEYNRWIAAGVLAVLLFLLYAFIRSDVGFRILHRPRRQDTDGRPEQMV
jgi:poly-gamma-glutamate system protein